MGASKIRNYFFMKNMGVKKKKDERVMDTFRESQVFCSTNFPGEKKIGLENKHSPRLLYDKKPPMTLIRKNMGATRRKKYWADHGRRAHELKKKKMGVPKIKKRWANAHFLKVTFGRPAPMTRLSLRRLKMLLEAF